MQQLLQKEAILCTHISEVVDVEDEILLSIKLHDDSIVETIDVTSNQAGNWIRH